MTSRELQEIIISTIENIVKNNIANTDYLTLITGQISSIDKFNNYYKFIYQKEEYTGFSITGEKYIIGDMVYVLKINNDVTTKQMIISKVNSYANFDIEKAISDTLQEIEDSLKNQDSKTKEITIIGNTVFTLNDDLTITPEELSLSAQKSADIEDIKWFIDGVEQVRDDLKRLVISNDLVEDKDSLLIRVEDLSNSEVYDEVTVIRALAADTKLELDLGLDSILLQQDEQGVIDYSRAIITPRVLSDNEDVTSQGWEIEYRIESGDLVLAKEQNTYKILEMNSGRAKISFFAKKNGNMYLQRVIYATIVGYGSYQTEISVSNQNFTIPIDAYGETKSYTVAAIIRATRGDKVLKIHNLGEIPSLNGVSGIVTENEDYTITYSWLIPEGMTFPEESGNLEVKYTVENQEYSSILLWATVQDGEPGIVYTLEITPSSVIKNGDGTLNPNVIEIKNIFKKGEENIPYNGYIKISKTIDNKGFIVDYESATLENSKSYTITDINTKALKVELLDENKKNIITEFVYINVNTEDFVENTTRSEENKSNIEVLDGKIETTVSKTVEIEENLTNLKDNTEQTFTQIEEQFTQIEQDYDSITSTVTKHTEQITDINGDIVEHEDRLTSAEEKLTADQWSLWFTEVVNNKTATSTKFTMDKNGLHIKGGGIDISNNAGTKVFYADTNGNLVIKNLTATNGTFTGTITGSTISGTKFTGGSISIGSYFKVDSSGNLTARGNASFSGTISGSYIDGGTVDGATIISNTSITTTRITGGRIRLDHSGIIAGYIGTNRVADYPSYKGIVFDLEDTGTFMSWSNYEGTGSYLVKFLYTNKSFSPYTANTLNAGCNLDMHNHLLKNVSFEGGTTSGTINFVQILEMASDGTVKRWSNDCQLVFKNGLLVSGAWAH